MRPAIVTTVLADVAASMPGVRVGARCFMPHLPVDPRWTGPGGPRLFRPSAVSYPLNGATECAERRNFLLHRRDMPRTLRRRGKPLGGGHRKRCARLAGTGEGRGLAADHSLWADRPSGQSPIG